jgi:hypothetical protein
MLSKLGCVIWARNNLQCLLDKMACIQPESQVSEGRCEITFAEDFVCAVLMQDCSRPFSRPRICRRCRGGEHRFLSAGHALACVRSTGTSQSRSRRSFVSHTTHRYRSSDTGSGQSRCRRFGSQLIQAQFLDRALQRAVGHCPRAPEFASA